MNVADEHSRWNEDLAAFAVGALDSEETVAFADHLAHCDQCRGELHRLAPAVELLPASVEQLAPPPALKSRLLEAIAADQETNVSGAAAAGQAGVGGRVRRAGAATSRAARVPLRERLRGWHVPALPAALAAAALAAAFAIGFAVRGDDGGGGTAVPRTTVPVVATAAAGRAPVRAQLISDAGNWHLDVTRLPRAGFGRVYQAWVMRRGRDVEPSTVFVLARDGSSTVAIPQSLAQGDQVLVTEEPAGGSAAPTTRPLLSATV
ncbi:anti-sigma factor [Conexibacter sp. JD483]|uniref:anti-sigma factor n=1 Tax=unclassified Conexibacter TaxID=2627773 RepID=UPI00271679DB|nr:MULTISPECIES: anti-sigma factor [unclassified Conexibacter]MDO8188158.1 anti-sigma factor [Conexibacter sp. CPCC 205706]MDO8202008.1 anti-sigma factor [Conexibacter sp. CPCC 205762]MDR9372462.1 anti-sigma factor [Conexibacter sp. JD483]